MFRFELQLQKINAINRTVYLLLSYYWHMICKILFEYQNDFQPRYRNGEDVSCLVA